MTLRTDTTSGLQTRPVCVLRAGHVPSWRRVRGPEAVRGCAGRGDAWPQRQADCGGEPALAQAVGEQQAPRLEAPLQTSAQRLMSSMNAGLRHVCSVLPQRSMCSISAGMRQVMDTAVVTATRRTCLCLLQRCQQPDFTSTAASSWLLSICGCRMTGMSRRMLRRHWELWLRPCRYGLTTYTFVQICAYNALDVLS